MRRGHRLPSPPFATITPRWWWIGVVLWCVTIAGAESGCRREPDEVPLLVRRIDVSDRFYDVHAIDADRAVVVGYGGKVLLTADGGANWATIDVGTQHALYRVSFVDTQHGWISGQGGVLLHSTDGGRSWNRQDSGTTLPLFSVFFSDRTRGWAVGDQSLLVSTTDGGRHWVARTIRSQAPSALPAEVAALSADPILYDVQFVDAQRGWTVGEFGHIYHSTDGGRTWREQQHTLLDAEVMSPLDLPTFFGVSFADAQHGLATGLDGKIARTRDGGERWRFDELRLPDAVVDPLFMPRLFQDGTGWAVGAAGEVLRRDRRDGPWRRAALSSEMSSWWRGMSWRTPQEGWVVGNHGRIWRTTDGGRNWNPARG